MHKNLADHSTLTDSMRMFLMGLEGGKPGKGGPGFSPNGSTRATADAGPGQRRSREPAFALDAGEEPEIAGIYLIDPKSAPVRLGFALANEFSDHVTERENYLWLAHSKLRPSGLGPELLVGDLPLDVRASRASAAASP